MTVRSNYNEDQNNGCCCFSMLKSKKKLGETSETVCIQTLEKQDEPYCYQLPSPLTAGNYIMLKGIIRENCLRFSINFKCDNAGQNIAFHLNPRLEQKYVVRNSKINGYWGTEETTSISKFNLAPGKPFQVNVVVTNEEFLVSINDKHYCGFAHRLPLRQITMIEVDKSVDVSDFQLNKIMSYPQSKLDSLLGIAFDNDYDENSKKNLDIPFIGILPKGFQMGWQLEVYGKVKLLPHSFYLNLQDGSQYWPHPIIPLHLNPRFSASIGPNTFVRNSWFNGSWSNEERAPVFPFNPGYRFCLIIRMEITGYSIWVDGKMCAEFPYKFPESERIVNCIYIQGDVVINHVTMRQKKVDAYFQKKNDYILKL